MRSLRLFCCPIWSMPIYGRSVTPIHSVPSGPSHAPSMSASPPFLPPEAPGVSPIEQSLATTTLTFPSPVTHSLPGSFSPSVESSIPYSALVSAAASSLSLPRTSSSLPSTPAFQPTTTETSVSPQPPLLPLSHSPSPQFTLASPTLVPHIFQPAPHLPSALSSSLAHLFTCDPPSPALTLPPLVPSSPSLNLPSPPSPAQSPAQPLPAPALLPPAFALQSLPPTPHAPPAVPPPALTTPH